MKFKYLLMVVVFVVLFVVVQFVFVKLGDLVKVSDDLIIDLIIEGWLCYEGVDQLMVDVDVLMMCLCVGVEFKMNSLLVLVEGEGMLVLVDYYNVFFFVVVS